MITTRKMASQALELRRESTASSDDVNTTTFGKTEDSVVRSTGKRRASDLRNHDQKMDNDDSSRNVTDNESEKSEDREIVTSSTNSFKKTESVHEDANANLPQYKCPICSVVSATQHDFTEHIRGHNNNTDGSQNYTCQICFKVVSSASSLDRHVLVHTGERPFTCKYCSVTFTTNGNMHRHMRTHKHRDLNNTNENENNSDDRNNTSESNVAKGHEQYESDGSTDSNRSENANYHFREGKRKMSNDDNNITNNFKRRLKTINNNNFKSITTTTSSAGTVTAQRFCCPVCIRNDFPNMSSLETHVDKEHPSIQAKCRYCEVVFKSYKSLNAHKCSLSQKAPFITQGFKDLTFVDFSSEKFPLIAKSMCEQSIRTPITNQKYECPYCYRAFPCTSAVEIHVKTCGLLKTDQIQKLSGIEKVLNENAVDEKTKRDIFFAHLDLKNANEKESRISSPSPDMDSDDHHHQHFIQSSQIKKEFAVQQMQSPDTKDLADIHSIIKNTSCNSGFLQHLDKPSILSVSPLDLPLSREEEEAQDAFTAEFRKMKLRGEFPCKLCTAVYPNLRALKGHNRIHLSAAGSGPYYCNMCPFFIHDKAALIRHMRTHNGDRPYECAICNYAFTTKANCERHLRNRHGKTTRDEVKRAIIYHPSEDSSCDDPIKKMQMYNNSYDDDEEDEKNSRDFKSFGSQEDETTEKPAKIQVKKIEQLIQQQSIKNNVDDLGAAANNDNNKPVFDTDATDLSMNVLDLSKGKSGASNETADDGLSLPDLSILEKQRMFLARQHLFNEMFPQIDPAQYLQLTQLYRNLVFPGTGFPLHPLFHPLLSQLSSKPTMPEARNESTAVPPNPLFPSGMMLNSMFSKPNDVNQSNLIQNLMQDSLKASQPQAMSSPLMSQIPPTAPQPRTPSSSQSAQPNPVTMTQTNQNSTSYNPGPVKMVIKNGVLMPKQKQRRYRTERPFACEHCSARFTLRSNMERHIKQQHPQFWAQRQRSGSNMMRRGSTGTTATSPISSNQPAASAQQKNPTFPLLNSINNIAEQTKYSNFFSSMIRNHNFDQTKQNQIKEPMNKSPACHDDEYDENEENNEDDNDSVHTDKDLVIAEEISEPEDLSNKSTPARPPMEDDQTLSFNKAVKNLLGKAIESSRLNNSLNISLSPVSSVTAQSTPINATSSNSSKITPSYKPNFDPSLKIFRDIADSGFGASPSPSMIKEDGDLVSVSKLVDNATNILSFGKYFRNAEGLQNEQSDEEGLVASGSASESNSGTEENISTSSHNKKKSAYSLAPNRVSCPYCQRMFPWSSSLRRHILTHTGQKPFKCSHCPLLFTTKSNCDRHLLRKHGDVESAVSLYVPIEDVQEIPVEKPPTPPPPPPVLPPVLSPAQINASQAKMEIPSNLGSVDLPFKCHLCDGSFHERITCLDHIKIHHSQEFALLLSKGALEADADTQIISAEDEEKNADYNGRGKYPDYTNRKVICAFCVRRFWSTEDLRRHMRTHSGERPFQCNICMRKFTLKHSMLRHQKKHKHHSNQHSNNSANSGSDLSDDEQMPVASTNNNNSISALKMFNIPDRITKDLSKWKEQMEKMEQDKNFVAAINRKATGSVNDHSGENEETSELIGNLLGISDTSILNKVLLSSADEAAKLLGVEK